MLCYKPSNGTDKNKAAWRTAKTRSGADIARHAWKLEYS